MSEAESSLRVGAGASKLSLQAVDALIARVQRLIDSPAEAATPLYGRVEASFLGDLPAIAALASVAARAAERQILIVRELAAPAARVYHAWTSPELIKRWWGGRRGAVRSAELDPRPRGAWRIVLADETGRELAFGGEFLDVVAGERIVSTEVEEAGGTESVNTAVFTDCGERTRLTLLIQLESSEARDAAIRAGMEDMLEGRLDLLERVAGSSG